MTNLSYLQALLYQIGWQGGYYKRHYDTPEKNCGYYNLGRGASAAITGKAAERRREISFLLYLAQDWENSHGGELRVFEPRRSLSSNKVASESQKRSRWVGSGRRGYPVMGKPPGVGSNSNGFFDVAPRGGTLVLMQSDAVAHEVLATSVERVAVVGWMTAARGAGWGNLKPKG